MNLKEQFTQTVKLDLKQKNKHKEKKTHNKIPELF